MQIIHFDLQLSVENKTHLSEKEVIGIQNRIHEVLSNFRSEHGVTSDDSEAVCESFSLRHSPRVDMDDALALATQICNSRDHNDLLEIACCNLAEAFKVNKELYEENLEEFV